MTRIMIYRRYDSGPGTDTQVRLESPAISKQRSRDHVIEMPFVRGIFELSDTTRMTRSLGPPSQLPAQDREVKGHSHRIYTYRCKFMARRDKRMFVDLPPGGRPLNAESVSSS